MEGFDRFIVTGRRTILAVPKAGGLLPAPQVECQRIIGFMGKKIAASSASNGDDRESICGDRVMRVRRYRSNEAEKINCRGSMMR